MLCVIFSIFKAHSQSRKTDERKSPQEAKPARENSLQPALSGRYNDDCILN